MKKNNKKGFTLIELLAVIVILAIIGLIATPVILGIVNNVKEFSMLRSSDMYLDSLELSIVNSITGSKEACENTGCKFYWLYDRTNSCPQRCEDTVLKTSGYWTASSKYGNTANIWFINYDGRIWSSMATASLSNGLRPVITITKSNI